MTLAHEELIKKIIGTTIEVHCRLGPDFLESIYENALILELCGRGMKVESQIEIPIQYCEKEIGKHRLDLSVEDTIVVELKAVKNLEDIHFAFVKSYLRAAGKHPGLLLNFAKTVIEVKRVMT